MKIGVIGSREFNDYNLLKNYLDKIHSIKPIDIIVSGGAKGADSLSEKWAKDNKIKTLIFKPNWNLYNKKAGFLRNISIVENSDYVIAFWDGKSKGTEHSINLCKKTNKKFKIVYYDKIFIRIKKIKNIINFINKNKFKLNI